MSPIIREPDGLEDPVKIGAGSTPFPDDLPTRSNPLGSDDSSAPKTGEIPEDADQNTSKADITLELQVEASIHGVISEDKGDSGRGKSFARTDHKMIINSNLKRSQSLKNPSKGSCSANDKKHVSLDLQTKATESQEDTRNTLSQSKPGKFKSLRNRFTVFPKASIPTNDVTETKNSSAYSLRRAQSMRIPQNKLTTTAPTIMTKSSPKSPRQRESSNLKGQYPIPIKNSKSLSDVHRYSKNNANSNTSLANVTLNNASKKALNSNNKRNETLPSKIKNSTEVSSVQLNASKNFAVKTINVICKSVQGKFKTGVERRPKTNLNSSTAVQMGVSHIGRENSISTKSTIKPSLPGKERIKGNSKRKQTECNDSDTESKPKKKILSKEASKTIKLISKGKDSKDIIIAPFSPKPTDRFSDKRRLETTKVLNQKNNAKTAMNLNKKVKEDKNVVINMKNNYKHKNTGETETLVNSSTMIEGKNIKCTSITTDPLKNPISQLHTHHALFLKNIHATLSHSCRSKQERICDENLNNLNILNTGKSLERLEILEPLNGNLHEMISSRLSGSLPFLPSKPPLKIIKPLNDEYAHLTKSLTDMHISDQSAIASLQEIDMKSISPMSISNSEDERCKTDHQSTMCFVNYDPYISETMGEYLNEDEEGTYFGSLFSQTKLAWESFGDTFIELNSQDTSSVGKYYLEKESLAKLGLNTPNDNNFHFNETNLGSFQSHKGSVASEIEHFPTQQIRVGEIRAFGNDSNGNFHLSLNEKYSLHLKDTSLYPKELLGNESGNITDATEVAMPSKYKESSSQEKTCVDAAEYDVDVRAITPKVKRVPSANKKLTNSTQTVRKPPKPFPRPTTTPNRTPKRVNNNTLIKTKQTQNHCGKPNSTQTFLLGRKKAVSQDLIPLKEKPSPMRKEKSELYYLGETAKQWELLLRPNDKEKEIASPSRHSVSPLSELKKRISQPKSIKNDEKKLQDFPLAANRRPKIDVSKASLVKVLRPNFSRTRQTDPVKVLRPAPQASQPSSQGIPSPGLEQLKRLEAELSARAQEAQGAKEEVARTSRGLEALTVLVHHLTREYDAFSTPKLKAEVERLTTQLTEIRLCLDESSATTRRLQDEATERCQKHAEELEELEKVHCQEISSINETHKKKIEEVLANHELQLKGHLVKEGEKHDDLVRSHAEQLERIDKEWRTQMDKQHERHLQALEQLNTCHTQQLKDVESSWGGREEALQETNARLLKEQTALRQQAKRLEETLLSDKDHRLQAVKNVCTALQSEVDSLKTVVEMRNSEVRKLRDQLADKEQITDDLNTARERVRALQAKTEDLHAQMEKKLQLERQLIADHHSLADSLQREASVNKRLSLENEELLWKLRQREAAAGSHSTPTLEMVTRCSTAIAQQQDRCKNGGISPQFTPRSQRIVPKSQDKKWSRSFSNIPDDAGKIVRRAGDISFESPPPSPRVKAVIEKSNSVSFILDLNDTFHGESILGESPKSSLSTTKPRTPNLQRKTLRNTFSNLEKSSSTSHIQGNSNVLTPPNLKSPEINRHYHKSGSRTNATQKHVIGDCNDTLKNDNLDRKYPDTHSSRDHSPSESSDSGEIERISPTGLAWTVPVHSMKRFSTHLPNRFQVVPEPPRLLQQPDEDEYEEMVNENEFVEVLALGDEMSSAPLTTLFTQTPSTSVSLSDSDISQCGSRVDLSTEEDCSDDDGTLLQKESQCRPQEGAGEAMIFPDAFDLKAEKGIEAIRKDCKEIAKSQISSAPSSDSEDANQPLNEDTGLNMSWSEDADCDLTSSSEMQELL